MKKSLVKPHLFYKFLIYYIVLLLMPMLIFGSIIYSSFIKILDKEIIDSNMAMLTQIKYAIEDKMFPINEKTIKDMLREIVKNNGGNVIVLDKNQDIITCLEKNEDVTSESLMKLIKTNEMLAVKKVKINGTDFMLSGVKSESSGWTYLTLIPQKNVYGKVKALEVQTIYGVAVIILIGGLVIFLGMNANYKPIKKLKSFTEEKFGGKYSGLNEIDFVHMAVEHMSTTANSLLQKVEKSHTAIKDALLNELLKGSFKDVYEFNGKAAEVGMKFTKEFFLAVVLDVDNLDSMDKHAVIKAGEDCLCPEYEAYGKECADAGTIAFAISSSNNDLYKINGVLRELQNHLKGLYRLKSIIGAGNIYTDIADISKSYVEASTAKEYRLVKGDDQVILFNEICSHNENISYYSNEELDKLEILLLQGDSERIKEVFCEVKNNINENKIPLFIIKYLCHYIVNTVMKAVHKINTDFNVKIGNDDIFSLTQYNTIDELSGQVCNLACEINGVIQKYKHEQKKNQIMEIKKYIEENYDDYNFSIQTVADHFQLSLPYLSNYFKNKSDENMYDYVNRLRMERAKQLLADSDEPLENIVIKVGYTNVSSFIRKFKQTTGITPGGYRKINERQAN